MTNADDPNPSAANPPDPQPAADVWGLWVEPDGAQWAVLRANDGRRTVISRHRSEQAANDAIREMNRSGGEDRPTDAARPG